MKIERKNDKQQRRGVSRRKFLGSMAATAAFTLVPRHVLGGPGHTPPSEKLNIAGIGIGGKGGGDIGHVSDENIVALCDVDDEYAANVFKLYPKAKKYRDFRRMLEKQKDIEAVVIATPDHSHAVITMTAIMMGKHVYCEKPLTHSIYETRKITEAARQAKVATQMGNQGHAIEGVRLICEWIWNGAIGPVRQVHVWTNRPGGQYSFPTAIGRPKDTPSVPSTLNWDLWLGPAPYRPYHPSYHPFSWRGWWDFGTGALGDMGCHIMDAPYWALKLDHPISVEASSTAAQYSKEINSETVPTASIVRYKFGPRGDMPPVEMTWYDGGLMPPRPEELEQGRRMGSPTHGGIMFVGDKGTLISGHVGDSPRLIPESKMQEYVRPPKTIPRSIGHRKEWVVACKGGKPAGSNFDYAGPLTEIVLLGNVAIRTGEKLIWDAQNMKVTNEPEANEYIHCDYRQGWTL